MRRAAVVVLVTVVLVTVVLLIPGMIGAPTPRARASALAQASVGSYALVDTWKDRPRRVNPDALREAPQDITSTPDGRLWVLNGAEVAAYGPDGHRSATLRLAAGDYGSRLDATPQGDLWVLTSRFQDVQVIRLRPDGSVAATVELTLPNATEYVQDVAATPDGGFLLTRTSTYHQHPSSLDYFGPDGRSARRVMLTDDIVPGQPYIEPSRVDVDAAGLVHLVYDVATCCDVPGPPAPRTPQPPRPTQPSMSRTGSPSTGAPDRRGRSQGFGAPFGDGVMLITDGGELQSVIDGFIVDDIVVGPAGIFLVDSLRMWRLFEGSARFIASAPTVDYYRPKRLLGAGSIGFASSGVALTPDGRLFLSTHACYAPGVLALGSGADGYRRARRFARVEPPAPEGPPFPIALDGVDGLSILQGPYQQAGGGQRTVANLGPLAVVQTWDLSGRPAAVVNLCQSSDDIVTDLAVDGERLVTMSPHQARSWPDGVFPDWELRDPAAYFMAVAAGGGQVALLDIAQRQVYLVASDGSSLRAVALASLGIDPRAVLDGIAIAGDKLLLADIGRDRVIVADPTRLTSREFATHDGPQDLAVGPGGDVFVLGRGGWGLRYSPDGALRAMWPMPSRQALSATDLAVDWRGRVHVSYVGLSAGPNTQGQTVIEQAGVWVFQGAEPEAGEPPRAPAGICLVERDKTAGPARIELGETVEVRLSVSGQCPRRMAPHQVVFVLDTSGSMQWDRSLPRAQAGLIGLLGAMDPWVGQAGLVTFGTGAALAEPLTGDLATMRAKAAKVKPGGDTQYHAGIELARLELTGARGDRAAQRTIVVVTDGGVKDDPAPAIQAARADGIGFLVLVYPNSGLGLSGIHQLLDPLFGDPAQFLFDLGPASVERAAERLRTWIEMPGLFETIEVRDEVPANMDIVPGSLAPPPAEVRGRTIVWRLGPVAAADGLRLAYRLRPLETGVHPTNVLAEADYVDVLGNAARFRFPVPRVEVLAPPPTAVPSPTAVPPRALYLPLLLREVPKRRQAPADIVLAVDTSSSMTGDKLEAAKLGVLSFIDGVDLRTSRVAVLSFDGQAVQQTALSDDVLWLKAATFRLRVGSGTRIDLGLELAGKILAGRPDLARDAIVILLTDGRHTGRMEDVDAAAQALRGSGARLTFVGLGADVDVPAMERWAGGAAGVRLASTGADLSGLFAILATEIGCLPADYWGRRCGGAARRP